MAGEEIWPRINAESADHADSGQCNSFIAVDPRPPRQSVANSFPTHSYGSTRKTRIKQIEENANSFSLLIRVIHANPWRKVHAVNAA
jgi:hypothetical protein